MQITDPPVQETPLQPTQALAELSQPQRHATSWASVLCLLPSGPWPAIVQKESEGQE